MEIITAVNVQQNDLNTTYERIRAISVPDHELRRRNDCCCAITKTAREKAQCFITAIGNPDDIPWPEADSVFDPTESSVRSLRLCTTSRVSSRVSSKLIQERQQQAAAEVAATHEVLKIMKTQHECEEEIRELEAEEKKITAQREAQEREMEAERARQMAVFVTESAARKRKLEEKKREVERLEELKRHNAAQARLKIYTEEDLQEHAASVPQHTQSIHATVGTTWDPAAYSSVLLQAQLKKPSFTLLPPVVQLQDQPTSVLQHIPNSHDIVGPTLKPAAYSFVPLPAPLSEPSFTLPPPMARLQDHLSAAPQLIQSAHATAGTMLDPAARSFVPVQVPASWPSATLPPPMALSHGHSIETAAPACTAVPQVDTQATSADSTNDLVRMLADAIAANRIPTPEPAIFFGNPLQYTDWKMSFNTLIHRKNLPAQEKLFFLRKYVGGEAKRAVEGYSLVGTEDAYTAAWSTLDDRFGNPFIIGKAYRDKIQSWHKISSRDSKDLREFADFLTSVTTAMSHTQGLQTLNDCVEIQKIAAKLPDWLSSRWNRTATLFQYEHKVFPDFKLFVTFLNTEARIACNPITSFQALKESEQEIYRPSDSDHKLHRHRNASAKTFSTSSSEKTSYVCKFCKWSGHSLNKCRKFMEMPVEDRVKFVQLEKLCFGCLKVGHSSKACAARSVCERCEKRHPTCLHQDRERSPTSQSHQLQQAVSGEPAESKHEQPNERVEVQQATSNRVIQQDGNTHTSSILPVYVSSTANPEKEILVYALLDTQSDTTFILKDVADLLHVERDPVRLKISTITSRSIVVSSSKLRGLQVRGLMSDERINLPITYTREHIPANKSDIPTCKTARGWPHLEHLADKMPPELDCEVGLLIGYNCPQVLLPRGVVSGKEGQPFAQKSVLGWSIIGYSNLDNDLADDIGISHRVISREITPTPQPLKSEVHFVYRTKVKEMLTPADHASRGSTANELLKSNWFTGPNFLWQRDLPKEEIKGEVCVDDPELRRAQVLTTKATEQTPLLSRLQKFSDWGRMIKATARLKRLARTLEGLKESSELTTLDERKDAELFIIRLVQEDAFCTEIKALKEKQEVTSTQSFRLHKLHPFVDKHNILRVGGRLTKATLHSDVKQPAILPKGHHVSRLLIKHFHEQICHQGRGMTMNEIRSKGFWILGCSSEVSSIIYLCLKCRKYRKSTQEQVMADLPPERLAATPPFTYSGMDCFGPFYVKEGRKELKRYGLLFTCMCSRAVHIEALTDLSSDSFLNALRCFISIRGNVRQLHSDQGTNFVGAKREFQELMKGSTEERMKELGCSFIFNPPSSSHMGGVWERQIRTVRSVLTAILDQSGRALDSSSLRTFMYEAMAIVNSRPLTSENLNDPLAPEPLTPNHILTMKSEIIAPPPGEFSGEDLYLRKRWKRVQYLANEFWRRWRKEYVLNLQQREKWYKNRRNTK